MNHFVDILHWQMKNTGNSKNNLAKQMVEKWGGNQAYNEMKRKYSNERLEDLLRNRGESMIEWRNHIIRKTTPIYQVPRSRIGRAQLYAPYKRLGSLYIDTFWFNLMVIWLSAVVYFITLEYDLLRKAVNWNQIRKLRKNR